MTTPQSAPAPQPIPVAALIAGKQCWSCGRKPQAVDADRRPVCMSCARKNLTPR